MVADGARQYFKSGEWKRLRRPVQVHQIVCEEHQAKDMTAICGRHCHNLSQLEQSLYAGEKAATVYEQYDSHPEWNGPIGACYCWKCQTEEMKPTQQQVEITRQSGTKPKFLEEKTKMQTVQAKVYAVNGKRRPRAAKRKASCGKIGASCGKKCSLMRQ